jgi:hypothetical protein
MLKVTISKVLFVPLMTQSEKSTPSLLEDGGF